VTVYALLLAIAGMAVVALATLSFGDVDSAALSLVTLALGVLSVAIAIGLWRMKNWARLVLITLQGLGIVGTLITSCRMMMEYDDPSSLIIALVQVVVSGSIIWWFAENDQLFG
jgi:hypothetical protein